MENDVPLPLLVLGVGAAAAVSASSAASAVVAAGLDLFVDLLTTTAGSSSSLAAAFSSTALVVFLSPVLVVVVVVVADIEGILEKVTPGTGEMALTEPVLVSSAMMNCGAAAAAAAVALSFLISPVVDGFTGLLLEVVDETAFDSSAAAAAPLVDAAPDLVEVEEAVEEEEGDTALTEPVLVSSAMMN